MESQRWMQTLWRLLNLALSTLHLAAGWLRAERRFPATSNRVSFCAHRRIGGASAVQDWE